MLQRRCRATMRARACRRTQLRLHPAPRFLQLLPLVSGLPQPLALLLCRGGGEGAGGRAAALPVLQLLLQLQHARLRRSSGGG